MLRITQQLADFASAFRQEDIPTDVMHQAARLILDTSICGVAGSAALGPTIVRNALLEAGSQNGGWATILGTSAKAAPRDAAYVNAFAANALDLDDNLLYFSHIACTVVPSAIAMAEHLNLGGRELLEAVAIGYEVAARVGIGLPGVLTLDGDGSATSVRWPNPFGHGFNILGSTVAAGRLLGLDREAMAHALGLAAYAAPVPSMTKHASEDRFSLSKYGAYGQQASTGVLCADLASRGLTADTRALDGPKGFWKMLGATSFDEGLVVESLGDRWWSLETSFKLVAAGTWMRPALTAVSQIREDPSFDPRQIEAMEIHTHPLANKAPEVQKSPQSYLDTQTNYHYLATVAVLGVHPSRWQEPETYNSQDVRRILARTTLHSDPESSRMLVRQLREPPYRAKGVRTRVRVRMGHGDLEAVAMYGDGDPFDDGTRITDEKLIGKLEIYVTPILGARQVRSIENKYWNIEGSECSARDIMKLFRTNDAGYERSS